MKKLRKFNKKNKIKIMFIGLLSLVIIVLFSLIFTILFKRVNKEYIISKNSVMFDINNNLIKLEQNANLKTKWNKNWYLEYNDKKYNLGSRVVVYNEANGHINLYGTFYEVKEKGEVIKINDRTVIESSVLSKFYKLSDRKYLIIDPIITSNNLTTSKYLIVDIEKSGYAFYTNNNVNVKTIEPTIITTSTYKFDVNNEKLVFNNSKEEIDLKKILGSTNEYKDNKDKVSSEGSSIKVNDENNGKGNTIAGNSNVTSGNNNQEIITNTIIENTVSDLINGTINNSNIEIEKRTSIIGVSTSQDSLNISYVVYDPKGEYKNVYVLINGEKKYLDKTLNNVIINSLLPNTTYSLEFGYSYYESNVLTDCIFETKIVKTKALNLNIKVKKIKNNKVYYEVDDVDNVTYGVIICNSKNNCIICEEESCNLNEISSYEASDVYTIKLHNIEMNGFTTNDNVYYKFYY